MPIIFGILLLGLSALLAEAGKESIRTGLRELEEQKRQQLK
ncbi:hypothetical protein ES703_87155 [subsurface metagenome]